MRFVLPDGTPTTLRAGDIIELHARSKITIKRIEGGAQVSIHFEKEGVVSRDMRWQNIASSTKFLPVIELLAAACGLEVQEGEDDHYHHYTFTLRSP